MSPVLLLAVTPEALKRVQDDRKAKEAKSL